MQTMKGYNFINYLWFFLVFKILYVLMNGLQMQMWLIENVYLQQQRQASPKICSLLVVFVFCMVFSCSFIVISPHKINKFDLLINTETKKTE
jgi:hypothetical protein